MIDIGGEMIAKGKNPQGWNWCIGIVRPKDDSTGQTPSLNKLCQTVGNGWDSQLPATTVISI